MKYLHFTYNSSLLLSSQDLEGDGLWFDNDGNVQEVVYYQVRKGHFKLSGTRTSPRT
jgi:hypothetical protein